MNTLINNVNQTNSDSLQWEMIACPVCDGNAFDKLFEKNNEHFVKCHECSLVLINPRPQFSRVLETYDDNYSQIYANKASKKLKRIKRWVTRVVKIKGNSGKWLDIGCSVGFVVKTANDLGFDTFGIDVQGWAVEYGKKHLGLQNLACGQLKDQKYRNNFFDVISIYDVIEHIPDLDKFMTEIKRILAKDGIIDIITPDIGHWRTPKKLSEWNEIKPSEHLYYFNKNTLSLLLNKYDLKIKHKRFHWKPSLRVYAVHA